MEISSEKVKELREMTSCGVMDCRRALQEARGDMSAAKELLRQRGLQTAAKKAERVAKEGIVESYIHLGNKIGVLVEINCETDFVARNDEFKKFSRDVAMQIAAAEPLYVRREDVPDGAWLDEAPEAFYKRACLLEQMFIKDQSITIRDYLNSVIAKTGENIAIRRFARFKVGA